MYTAREMTLPEKTELVGIIRKRILRELSQYYAQHSRGLPMQMLAAKYNTKIKNMGLDFPEFVDSMRVQGMLQIRYLEHGAREVYPTGVTIDNNAPLHGEWF